MEPHFRHLLVPTDLSETASHAIRLAVRLTRHGAGRLTLLHVGAPAQTPTFDFPIYGGSAPAALLQLQRELMAERAHVLARIAREGIPEDVQWDQKVREGYAPEGILEEVAAGDYDLVVMGTHGHTGVKHVLLGSVTERVLRRCEVPVLVTH